MDVASPIVDLLSRLWDCIARHTSYIRKLQENLSSLRDAMDRLKHLKNDVNTKLDLAQVQQMRPREEVIFWIQSVEAMEGQVNGIVEKGTQQISNRCLGGCCPKNCWSSYKVGKRVVKKLTVVEGLRSTGNFNDVADILPPADVEAMPSRPTVGMDLMFENVWRCLREEDQVGIIGLYGMGGVGKTTLLTKINNEFLHHGNHDFKMVIWVVVSKEFNLKRIQKDIGERVGLLFSEDVSQATCASRIFNALSKIKFVLLLDDIWDRVDFQAVGIPLPNSENKSKVIFTTRSKAVCGRMEAQKKIKVECLGWDEAWDLFQIMVGEEALNSHPDIPKLAKSVVKECAGLPLAINTIGRAMASNKTPQEWNHAITVLKKSASEFSGMEDEVLSLLKFSYDSLPNGTLQSCFLYCSLFPEDFNISKKNLIEYWIGEGFIVEYDNMNEAINQGHYIIETLKQACLLEGGLNEDFQVKMHDVIRDLALWIACECGRKRDKLLVKAGFGLIEAPEVEKWEEAERISLIENNIKKLRENPMCPILVTLLLNKNRQLVSISNGFFKSMTSLRVLDLSGSSINDFPMEITELVELQYLNLSYTNIETVPDELKILVKLKYLNLEYTTRLKRIPIKAISRLPRLQVLNLYNSSVGDSELEEGWRGANLEEFEFLRHLQAFGITITTVSALQSLSKCQKLSRCTNNLLIYMCPGLISFPLSPLTLGDMKCLEKFEISSCSDLEELIASSVVAGEGENGFTSSLERLYVVGLPKLKMVRTVARHPCFQKLSILLIERCDALKDLTWLLGVRSLRTLHLDRCKEIEEVICGGVATVEEELITFSGLRFLYLGSLPRLKSICRHALPFPSLEWIKVYDCLKLKKLPLDSNSGKNTLNRIVGQKQWWDQLEWEDEFIKSVFEPYLRSN